MKIVYIYTLAPHKETNVYNYCSNGDGQGLNRMLAWDLCYQPRLIKVIPISQLIKRQVCSIPESSHGLLYLS